MLYKRRSEALTLNITQGALLKAKTMKRATEKSGKENCHDHETKNTSNGTGQYVNGKQSTKSIIEDAKKFSYTQGAAVIPPLLVFLCPAFAMVLSYTFVKLNGSPYALFAMVKSDGWIGLFQNAWLPYIFGSKMAWCYILPYAAFQLILMRILPGKETKGPITPAGNVPVYKANGLLSYFVTLAAFFGCAYGLNLFDPADIYDHYLEIIGAMNVVSLVFCALLIAKGRILPSSTDNGTSGSVLFDYYWGTELYPRVLGWDIKMFTNCRWV